MRAATVMHAPCPPASVRAGAGRTDARLGAPALLRAGPHTRLVLGRNAALARAHVAVPARRCVLRRGKKKTDDMEGPEMEEKDENKKKQRKKDKKDKKRDEKKGEGEVDMARDAAEGGSISAALQSMIDIQSRMVDSQLRAIEDERRYMRERERQLTDEISELRRELLAVLRAQNGPAAPAPPATPPPTPAPEPATPAPAAPAHGVVFGKGPATSAPAAAPAPAAPAREPETPPRLPAHINTTGKPIDIPPERRPKGPPPEMSDGSDDIFWVHQLHQSLMAKGYYAGDDEIEAFFFGETTLRAVLTFQACEGLEESGTVAEAEWKTLLGKKMVPKDWPVNPADLEALEAAEAYSGALAESGALPATQPTTPVSADPEADGRSSLVSDFFKQFGVPDTDSEPEDLSSDGDDVPAPAPAKPDGWPTLREGDGDENVHKLQLLLMRKGFFSGEEDMKWWMMGDSTMEALKTYQASEGLPESGIATAKVWRLLLGDANAEPGALADVRAESETEMDYSQDMSQDTDGMVYLLGEQRWTRVSKESGQ
ncbi:unnamed protein product [Pedinophyceae sp. YPF-701]|nr:unnamed protein product [Pedinophyceae sp. YPF-701]